ncbi:MAG: calcium-binding protein, partial [Selenomonadaceae bacterium]|nr:calcium-binding protein [Selenomonadaceae bacterium]
MASITNDQSNTTISAERYESYSIYNSGDNVKIFTRNYHTYTYEDYIENHGNHVEIYTYGDNDEIQNYGTNALIHGGVYDDTVYNYSDAIDSSLCGDVGDDEIRNYAASTYIDGGDGNDTIRNFGANAIIHTDGGSVSGANIVEAFAANVTVNVNGGNDTISAYAGDGTIILGGARNDTITLVKGYSNNNGAVARVDAGRGNDVIIGSAGTDIYQYSNSDFGDDIIYGYDENDTIELLSNIYRGQETIDNDVVIHAGYGSITIKDAADQKINLKTDGTTTFKNVVDNRSANVVINGSDGNDSIKNSGTNVVIYANYGNDTIINSASNVTINAGGGVDTFVHSSGSNAVVYNYSSSQDRFQLTSGSISGSSLDGDDVMLYIGSDIVTVKSAKDKTITVTDARGRTSARVYGNSTVDTVEPEPTVPSGELPDGWKLTKKETVLTVKKPFRGTVDVNDYSDAIVEIKASSNPNALEIIGNDNDNKITASKGGSTMDGGEGNDTLVGSKGVDVFVF